jgi:hypothetical protein
LPTGVQCKAAQKHPGSYRKANQYSELSKTVSEGPDQVKVRIRVVNVQE